MKCNSQNN